MGIGYRRSLAVALLLAGGAPLAAQEPESGDAPPPAAEPPAAAEGRQSYPASDFARFSPTSALDMLENVPGFQIRGDDERRGLGQANENVLVNGQRLSSKSDGLFDQLARIPAESVVRIDIVDGATLSIPGLSGQVADVITRPDAFSGQFNWRGEVRPHYSHPGYLNGEVSIKGVAGKFEYSLAASNESSRGAFGGPYEVFNGDGSLRESRSGRLWSDYDAPKLAAGLKFDGPGGSIGNLNMSYSRVYSDYEEDEDRFPVDGIAFKRLLEGRERGYDYEIGGDYEFGLAGARLKLIALDRFAHNVFSEQAVLTFEDGADPQGVRYAQVVNSGEVIGRAELSWKWGKADWQLAAEGAFNRLDKEAGLFELEPGGAFAEVPFPGGDGGVREDRYEAILSYGRPLTSKLTMQLSAGAEKSTISQAGANALSRTFVRPKGSASLAWTPEQGLDISLKIAREVGQLDFGDFLARVFLEEGNENANNPELAPTQSWNVELAIKKNLGKWGSTNIRFFDRRFEDYIEVIPLPGGGEGRGNIDHAERRGFEWTSTINLDPVGFRGARLDSNLILQTSSLRDPLTGEKRQMSGLQTRYALVELRHDVPGSDWAWGAGIEHIHVTEYYRTGEFGLDNEGPVFDFSYLEHKDVMGLTVRLQIVNLLNARHKLYRTVYKDRRNNSPIAFIERRDQLIGPIFRLSFKGTF